MSPALNKPAHGIWADQGGVCKSLTMNPYEHTATQPPRPDHFALWCSAQAAARPGCSANNTSPSPPTRSGQCHPWSCQDGAHQLGASLAACVHREVVFHLVHVSARQAAGGSHGELLDDVEIVARLLPLRARNCGLSRRSWRSGRRRRICPTWCCVARTDSARRGWHA